MNRDRLLQLAEMVDPEAVHVLKHELPDHEKFLIDFASVVVKEYRRHEKMLKDLVGEQGGIPPEEFEETFKKHFKDILA